MPMLGKKANIQTRASLLGNMPMVFLVLSLSST
jgi:hypothetical protein